MYLHTTNTLLHQKDLNRRGIYTTEYAYFTTEFSLLHNEEGSVFFYAILHIHLLGDMNNEKGEVQYEQM